MEDILVSINCITYNHEKYISDAIESFLMQKTDFKFEILIDDDASTDKTPDIIRDYSNKYSDIIMPLIESENQYSKGIDVFFISAKRARGKYIAICEGDDYWTDPYKLQKQVDYMINHNECSMCFHAAEIVKDGEGRVGLIKPYDEDCISTTDEIILGGGGFIATNSIMYRRDAMDNVPDYFLNFPINDYCIQILASTKSYAYYINEIMSTYRTGVEGSWTERLNSGKDCEKKVISMNKSNIEMLNELNRYSNGRYCDAINKKILMIEFEILKIEGKIKQLKLPKYRTIYDSLGINEKVKIYVKCQMPYIYHKFSEFKRFIKKLS